MHLIPFAFFVINAFSQLANMLEEGQACQRPTITAPAQRTGGSGGGRIR